MLYADVVGLLQAHIDKITMRNTFINFGSPKTLRNTLRTQRLLRHAVDLKNNGWQVVVVGPNSSWCFSCFDDLSKEDLSSVHLLDPGANHDDIKEPSGIWFANVVALQHEEQWDWQRLRMTYDTEDNVKRRYLVEPLCMEIHLLANRDDTMDPVKYPRAAFELHRYDEDDTNQWIAGDVLLSL